MVWFRAWNFEFVWNFLFVIWNFACLKNEPARDIPLSRAGSIEAMWHPAGLTPEGSGVSTTSPGSDPGGIRTGGNQPSPSVAIAGSSWPGWMLLGRLVSARFPASLRTARSIPICAHRVRGMQVFWSIVSRNRKKGFAPIPRLVADWVDSRTDYFFGRAISSNREVNDFFFEVNGKKHRTDHANFFLYRTPYRASTREPKFFLLKEWHAGRLDKQGKMEKT